MFIVVFFFSSRRRHTRCLSDWSSDVCSSDLDDPRTCVETHRNDERLAAAAHSPQAKSFRRKRSEVRRVGKSVDLGSRRRNKKKKNRKKREKGKDKKKQMYKT